MNKNFYTPTKTIKNISDIPIMVNFYTPVKVYDPSVSIIKTIQVPSNSSCKVKEGDIITISVDNEVLNYNDLYINAENTNGIIPEYLYYSRCESKKIIIDSHTQPIITVSKTSSYKSGSSKQIRFLVNSGTNMNASIVGIIPIHTHNHYEGEKGFYINLINTSSTITLSNAYFYNGDVFDILIAAETTYNGNTYYSQRTPTSLTISSSTCDVSIGTSTVRVIVKDSSSSYIDIVYAVNKLNRGTAIGGGNSYGVLEDFNTVLQALCSSEALSFLTYQNNNTMPYNPYNIYITDYTTSGSRYTVHTPSYLAFNIKDNTKYFPKLLSLASSIYPRSSYSSGGGTGGGPTIIV